MKSACEVLPRVRCRGQGTAEGPWLAASVAVLKEFHDDEGPLLRSEAQAQEFEHFEHLEQPVCPLRK